MRLLTVLLATLPLVTTARSRDDDASERFREKSLTELRDRVEGGWAGQMIGVSFGEPTEFRFLERISSMLGLG